MTVVGQQAGDDVEMALVVVEPVAIDELVRGEAVMARHVAKPFFVLITHAALGVSQSVVGAIVYVAISARMKSLSCRGSDGSATATPLDRMSARSRSKTMSWVRSSEWSMFFLTSSMSAKTSAFQCTRSLICSGR